MRRRILHRPRGFWTLEKPRFATTVNGGQRLAQKACFNSLRITRLPACLSAKTLSADIKQMRRSRSTSFCIRCCKAMTRWHCRPISNSAEQIKNSICWSAGNCKGNYVGITDPPDEMFGKLMRISDPLMWRYYTLLSSRTLEEIEAFRRAVQAGRNPRDFKVQLAQEIVARFHSSAAAARALQDFNHRAHGGIPDKIPALTLRGAPLAIGILLKQAGLTPSSSEALRCVEQGGVRMDGVRIRDKALKVAAGTYVVQVGKRRFARVLIT